MSKLKIQQIQKEIKEIEETIDCFFDDLSDIEYEIDRIYRTHSGSSYEFAEGEKEINKLNIQASNINEEIEKQKHNLQNKIQEVQDLYSTISETKEPPTYTNSEILDIIKNSRKANDIPINHDHIYRTTEKIPSHKKDIKAGKNNIPVFTVSLNDFMDALRSSNILKNNQDKIIEIISDAIKNDDPNFEDEQMNISFDSNDAAAVVEEAILEKIESEIKEQEPPSLNDMLNEEFQLISGVRKGNNYYMVIHGETINDIRKYVKIPKHIIENEDGNGDVNDIASVIATALEKFKNNMNIF